MDARARFDKLLPTLKKYFHVPTQAKIPFSGRLVTKALYVFNWFSDEEDVKDEVSDLLGDVSDEEEMEDFVSEGSLVEGLFPFAYVVNDGAFDDGEMDDYQCEGLLVLDLREGDGAVLFAEVDGTIIPDQGFETIAPNLAAFPFAPYDKDVVGNAEALPGGDDEEDD